MHPGSMGAAVGAQLRSRGIDVLWCPEGRSATSRRRADEAGLEGVPLDEAVGRADVVLSLCAPVGAEDVARRVAAVGLGEGTLFVEANAISPARAVSIAGFLPPGRVVDGAVVGSPPVDGKSPLLYLSGPEEAAERVAALFAGTSVDARVIGQDTGQASALKLIYSSYQKTSRVLAALAHGAADAHGVSGELLEIAGRRSSSHLVEPDYIPKTVARAWRWAPELADAAELLDAAGLPAGTIRAAADTLEHWASERDSALDVTEALRVLRVTGR
ncbi:DUF1932 domain-containing protein [Streptomyces sp. NPDC006324]|uniref:DUF1932 domain-containing protein n=1 Tax=Streptomyces sp. NPDC006324 TaxID=3156751 RepID=UPI0033B2A016